jgi:sister-chromatid-cohesion protein PDS5
MAPRRGAEVEQEPPLGSLSFNQPLSWRAGRPIATGELLKRLDALSNELREMDQEETDKDSLTSVAKELAAPNLLNHKDKGVRAFTACCLVDILKLCAPDAPFTATQLKVIFHSSTFSTANSATGYFYPIHNLHTPRPFGPF